MMQVDHEIRGAAEPQTSDPLTCASRTLSPSDAQRPGRGAQPARVGKALPDCSTAELPSAFLGENLSALCVRESLRNGWKCLADDTRRRPEVNSARDPENGPTSPREFGRPPGHLPRARAAHDRVLRGQRRPLLGSGVAGEGVPASLPKQDALP